MAERLLEQLASSLNDALPQTQCTRCGYPDCDRYAHAIASGEASVNRCPPGGAEGVTRLAALAGGPPLPLDPACGLEAPRRIAVIDEATCIGCTLCLKACPVDCIVGAAKQMHTVIDMHCTGCELCVPACPVDCISMPPVTEGRTGWQAWSARQARDARERYERHRRRLERGDGGRDQHSRASPAVAASGASPSAKRSVIAAALAKARSSRST